MTFREHIEQLAAEQGITIYNGRERYRSAINVLTGDLYLADWDDQPVETYWVALHELGHWFDLKDLERYEALRGTPGDPSFTEAEARAWAWALDNALPEAFPLGQVGESNIAWSITDYMHGHGWRPSPSFEKILKAVGPDPDWFHDVWHPSHYAKLESWARPLWADLVAAYEVKPNLTDSATMTGGRELAARL